MKIITKNTSVEAIKFDCPNDISDINSFTGADAFVYNEDRLFLYGNGVSLTVKLGQYVVKLQKQLLTLTEEEFESL